MIPLVYHSVLLHAIYMNIVMNVEIQNNNSNINNDDVNVHIIPEIVPFWLQEEKKNKRRKMGRNKWKDDNRMWSFVNWMVIEVTLIFVLFQVYPFEVDHTKFFKNFLKEQNIRKSSCIIINYHAYFKDFCFYILNRYTK